jgi:FdhD protein
MILPLIYRKCAISSYDRGRIYSGEALVVSEMNLTIILDDAEPVIIACSPIDCTELAVGYLLSAGLLQEPADIKEITCSEEEDLIRIKTGVRRKEGRCVQSRECCAKRLAPPQFSDGAGQIQTVHAAARFAAAHLLYLINLMEECSTTFRKTGGVHCAALAGTTGPLLVMCEDISRHNAADKVLGHAFLKRISLEDKCLLLSARVSAELLIKAARRGVPLVISRSAPTFSAVEMAERLNVTLIGFARGERLSIYSHGEKVVV